jgi:hypothetical protein
VTPTNGPVDGPGADGFANVTVAPGGNIGVSGTLADNTGFSQSTGVFTNGVWPLYAKLNNGSGMLIGWETNLPSGTCAGSLFWIRSPIKGDYYPNGLGEKLTSFGAEFVPPAPGTNYQMVIGGGSVTTPVINKFTFKNGQMVPASATNKLTGSITSKGVLKGSIVNPFNGQVLKFDGLFISPSEGGSGFTLDTGTNTGYFNVTLAPE